MSVDKIDKATKLKTLKTVWYEKLRKSGFVDIEDAAGNLKFDVGMSIKRQPASYTTLAFTAHRYYYSVAARIAEAHRNRVWRLHAQGLSIRTISKRLDRSFHYVRVSVNKLKKLIKEQISNEEAEEEAIDEGTVQQPVLQAGGRCGGSGSAH